MAKFIVVGFPKFVSLYFSCTLRMYITWEESDVTKLIEFTKRTFNDNDRSSLEKCVRNCTVSGDVSNPCHTHSHGHHSSDFKRNEGDVVGRYLDDLWSSRSKITLFLEEVIESASESYRNVVNKGLKDGLALTSASDSKIAYFSWKKTLVDKLQRYIVRELKEDFIKTSSEGRLFSLGNEYNNFESETISQLMNENYAVVKSFVGPKAANSFSEVEFMEYNALFKKIDKASNPFYENCYILWLKSSYLDEEKQKSTAEILNKLWQIPYELTYKCKVLLQVVSTVCVTYMKPGESSILKHADGKDGGVKITCLYVPKSSFGACVELTVNESVNKVDLKSDQLIILRYF
ncbi:conserved hypothetical protein [Theileria orientalis strain Shintoku]|uniref:Uncharacterized protein n=1 Tax=Theileria orientalis strain Shintoku TaxID=869250 RepID=J7MBX6_THEOR|nr:conserved hypothetical protein [Theileria orientalis strain Shintoku]PVC54258.1 hypothetical protein MACL_00003228 [Theileria orientalis]BAM38667.1 conserved hypothetical protein [Theileria orientalis strain Shintoku]|eukprot:XP_009688968.1 conserved hypothetical protein [Theileria orientalis strain Shintoku]